MMSTSTIDKKLPESLLIDDLLPLLSLRDALSIFQANKFSERLGRDDTFWRRRLKADFNYTGVATAKNSGFKFLYRCLNEPMVYVWGESTQGRLGRALPERTGGPRGQYWPIQLDIPGCRIVDIVSGGWSFSALDSEGRVHVWGQLNSDYNDQHAQHGGFAHRNKQASRPLRLELPTKIQAISCGRNFTTALDHLGSVWCYNSWGRPFVFKPTSFDHSDPGNEIVQVECGWSFSVALNRSGTVFVWSPAGVEKVASQLDSDATAVTEVDGTINCRVWNIEGIEPLRLPELPRLPSLVDCEATIPRLVKVAGGDLFIIGLTDAGHVLKLELEGINDPDAVNKLDDLFRQHKRGWEYMPLFSETRKVKGLREFNTRGGPTPPSRLKISHISAHFRTFTAYSIGKDSIVLTGNNNTSPTIKPTVIRSLQNRGVISIVLGDYHSGALLDDGRLLTWGKAVAAGLGDPTLIQPGSPGGFRTKQEWARGHIYSNSIPDISEPTEVRLDHGLAKPRKRFVFAAAAAGWHMGALVVDLNEEEPERCQNSTMTKSLPTAIFQRLTHRD